MESDAFQFKEIEHKYVVGDDFDLQRFRDVLATLGPTRTHSICVRDWYYLTEGGHVRRYLIRHRFDAERHHLTIKTIEPDTQMRDEVNLDLGHHAGDQAAHVAAFMACLGVRWSGTVRKDLDVWYFADCEVVHYVASTDVHAIRCVEFEATRRDSLTDALAIVGRFERATGFDRRVRLRLSLPQMLFPELSAHLRP